MLMAVALALPLAACPGSESEEVAGSEGRRQTSASAYTGTASSDPRQTLEDAVQAALRENDRLSGYVLWHNRVPAWAKRSTRGPALAALRAAAAERRQEGIRVRTLSNRYEILAIELNPSFERATATVRSRQRVRRYRDGEPIGRVVSLDERATVELRRLDETKRFVVWRLMPA